MKQLYTDDTTIKQKATSLCDQCSKVEDKTHLFTCQGPQMMKAKKDGWEQVKKKLRSSTHPTILHQLYQGFHSVCWNHVPEIGAMRTREDELTAICFQEQTEIGWQHMMLGRMGKTWGDTNESMTKNLNTHKMQIHGQLE